MSKKLIDLNLGEVMKESEHHSALLKGNLKCVARSVTLQDEEGTQMQLIAKHKDFIEDEEEEKSQ